VFHGQYSSQYAALARVRLCTRTTKRGRKSTPLRAEHWVTGLAEDGSAAGRRLSEDACSVRTERIVLQDRGWSTAAVGFLYRRVTLWGTANCDIYWFVCKCRPHATLCFSVWGYSIVIRISEQDKPDTRRRVCEDKNMRARTHEHCLCMCTGSVRAALYAYYDVVIILLLHRASISVQERLSPVRDVSTRMHVYGCG
jgi:hypothetical protein